MVGSAHPTSKSNGCKMSSASLLLRAGRRLLGLGGAPRDAAAWGPLAAGGARQVRRGGHWNRGGWCGCLSTNAWAHQQAPTPRPAPPACQVQGQQQPGGDQGRGAGQRQSAHVHATGRPRRVPQASGALQCRVRRECALSVLAAGPRRLLLCCARTATAARAAAPVLVCGLMGTPCPVACLHCRFADLYLGQLWERVESGLKPLEVQVRLAIQPRPAQLFCNRDMLCGVLCAVKLPWAACTARCTPAGQQEDAHAATRIDRMQFKRTQNP